MKSKKNVRKSKTGVTTRRMAHSKHEKEQQFQTRLMKKAEEIVSHVTTRQMNRVEIEEKTEICAPENQENTTEKTAKSRSKNSKELIEYGGSFEIFLVGDIVWTKLKGHPVWPAKVLIIIKILIKNLKKIIYVYLFVQHFCFISLIN